MSAIQGIVVFVGLCIISLSIGIIGFTTTLIALLLPAVYFYIQDKTLLVLELQNAPAQFILIVIFIIVADRKSVV